MNVAPFIFILLKRCRAAQESKEKTADQHEGNQAEQARRDRSGGSFLRRDPREAGQRARETRAGGPAEHKYIRPPSHRHPAPLIRRPLLVGV